MRTVRLRVVCAFVSTNSKNIDTTVLRVATIARQSFKRHTHTLRFRFKRPSQTAKTTRQRTPTVIGRLPGQAPMARSSARCTHAIARSSSSSSWRPWRARCQDAAKAVENANKQLAKDGVEPLPDGLTPNSLRRTFAPLLFAIGEAPPCVMAQMGHTTPALALAIYARRMDRRGRRAAAVKGAHRGPRTGSSHAASLPSRRHAPR